MTSLAIRPAAESDVPRITAIYADAVATSTATFEIDPPDETEMRRRLQVLLAGRHPYLVAEDHGLVLGYAYAGPYHVRPGYRHTVEDSVYIAGEARRRGLGRRLLGALIAESRARGFRQMIAIVGDSDQVASIALHRACGFVVAGTLIDVGHKFGRWLDIVFMQRQLDAETPSPR